MQNILYIIQIVSALALIGAILLQNRGTGLGGAFGSSTNVFATKRGAEKILFIGTIILAVIFFSATLLNFILPRLS